MIWTIAGFDGSGGAGILADLNIFKAFGLKGKAVTTTVTAQNGYQVTDASPVSPNLISAQIGSLKKLGWPKVIKIGLLTSPESILCIQENLKDFPGELIYDPVMKSSTGYPFVNLEMLALIKQFVKKVSLLTPNIAEAEVLTGIKITCLNTMQRAASLLCENGVKAVILKGGHLAGEFAQDIYTDGKITRWLTLPKKEIAHSHGTGCCFSAALAACLAQGYEILDAFVLSKMKVYENLFEKIQIPWFTLCPFEAQKQYQFPRCERPLGFYPIFDNSLDVRSAIDNGVKSLQLRLKTRNLSFVECDREISEAIEQAKDNSLQFFINDNWQDAIKHRAYGIHLGQADLETADMNAIEKAGLRLGISTHSYAELARAMAFNPSYIAFGSIYLTTSKAVPFPPQGLERLKQWRKLTPCQLIAIGGIDLSNVDDVLACGVDGYSTISASKKFIALRYGVQIRLAEIGLSGQKKLSKASVLCIGAGGLGTIALSYLARAGIGTLGICDPDRVSLDNLHRQILYQEDDVGKCKAIAAVQRLKKINSDIYIHAFDVKLTSQNALSLLSSYDYIIDATDHFNTKLLLNDACHQLQKPFITASCQQFSGQLGVFWYPFGPCLRCVFEENFYHSLPSCTQLGILGMVSGFLGLCQSMEVIKLCLGFDHSLLSKMAYWDVLRGASRVYELKTNNNCPLCTKKERFDTLWPYPILSKEVSVRTQKISAQQLSTLLSKGEDIFLLDVRNPDEHHSFNLGGVLIPLPDLLNRMNELPMDKIIIIYCHSGIRSQMALELLQSKGFQDVINLEGGVLAWKVANS